MQKQFRSTFVYMLLVGILGFAGLTIQAQNDAALIEALMEEATAFVLESSEAPDGNSRAEIIRYPCTEIEGQEYSYERLDFINNDSDEVEIINEQLLSCGGMGSYGLGIVRWTDNYLYYTTERVRITDFPSHSPPFFSRANRTTFENEELGSAEFSPDGQWLAIQQAGNIVILGSDSDEQNEFALLPDNQMLMQVIWLPDSSGILYIQSDSYFESSQSSVTHIDLTTMEQTVVVNSTE